jgi:hypothetical protein
MRIQMLLRSDLLCYMHLACNALQRFIEGITVIHSFVDV